MELITLKIERRWNITAKCLKSKYGEVNDIWGTNDRFSLKGISIVSTIFFMCKILATISWKMQQRKKKCQVK